METILIQAGPPHLFHTTGLFFVWALKERYKLILLATDEYLLYGWFNILLKLNIFVDVAYFPHRNGITAHHAYKTNLPSLIKKYQPICVLMHSEFFVDNLYLIHFLKTLLPSAKRLYFQPGRMGVDIKANSDARRADQTSKLMQKYYLSRISYRTAAAIVNFRNTLSLYINCKLLPLFFLGKQFSPPVDYLTGRLLFNSEPERLARADPDGIHFQYFNIEATAAHAHGAASVVKISHPARIHGHDALTAIYGQLTPSANILILPSYGFTSMLLVNGVAPELLISNISQLWFNAIQILMEKYPMHSVSLKLHPAASYDPVWIGIVKQLIELEPRITILDATEPAELHIAKSKIVVGDVSSALWWASVFDNKIVVSLDIFSYPGGGEMKKYADAIWYFSSLDELRSAEELSDARRSQEKFKDICEVLKFVR